MYDILLGRYLELKWCKSSYSERYRQLWVAVPFVLTAQFHSGEEQLDEEELLRFLLLFSWMLLSLLLLLSLMLLLLSLRLMLEQTWTAAPPGWGLVLDPLLP
jgi:hypothetical protein